MKKNIVGDVLSDKQQTRKCLKMSLNYVYFDKSAHLPSHCHRSVVGGITEYIFLLEMKQG